MPRQRVAPSDLSDACAPPTARCRAKTFVETPCITLPSHAVVEAHAGLAASSDCETPVPQVLG